VNVLSLEAWYTIKFLVFMLFLLVAIILASMGMSDYVQSKWVKKAGSSDKFLTREYCWTFAATLCFMMTVLYIKGLSDSAYVNDAQDMIYRRTHIEYICTRSKDLGCPAMWKQYRADSMWLERELGKYKGEH